ncbi:leucine-rich repeat-containing protein 74B isoform X4 [Erinaceus europaeus]|uniref:Leucine-rich repeat-containing protein 74B isoform X4 n=1 Tax=Erinaceus europaeus TaxID=9365 RepID=A0ABM3XN92_ERIEU|nr:leucine-rich repeat-containing protein 74B isoform X4 [Erinaceus europaeus]
MRVSRENSIEDRELERGAAAPSECPARVLEAEQSTDADSDFDVETEGSLSEKAGIRGLGEVAKDTIYLGSCQTHGVVPASSFLRQGSSPELSMPHRGLGPQGVRALASALITNPYIRKLDLRDNGLCVTGAKALANALSKTGSIYGETLGPALAENTGLTELNLSWNHLRGPGAIAFARGLEANIFLKVLDISYNGFGDTGASAVGEALKTNNVLEELNMSNNRISAVGALGLGLGLRVNQTLRILVMARNPMRSEGCSRLLQSLQNNPLSVLELLDFSDIQVDTDFDDLSTVMKALLPGLCIKTAARRMEYKKDLLGPGGGAPG